MTTELQPSPAGYRQATSTSGPEECPSGLAYRGGSYGNAPAPQVDFKQSSSRRRSAESEELTAKSLGKIVDGYEEQPPAYCQKKNAPGYKNDSGYSESLGFESFSLPLSERDAASPPPTPPVRDASSLKSVCYGPGHEKYPSWPSAPECRYTSSNEDDEDAAQAALLQQHHGASGSHRSKSWTDHTNYPKEKPAQYTRPHTKRPNSTFTQQLKTVMERCEKIPAETFESRARNSDGDQQAQQQQLRMWPSVDREGKTLGDAEYVVPSPPERESLQGKTLSPADLEAYVRSYQDPQVSQVELYGESDLTQTGLDEYTTVQHSQQASYAQSEGYHSYVSSVDSTTTTPFLDRLRRDSEAVSQRPLTSWEDGSSSREGRDSVVTTSSGSASSSETLKWHGSMSDVSVSSGMPTSRSSGIAQDRWHHGSMSDISSINGGPPPIMQKSSDVDHEKWQDSLINDDHHHHHSSHHKISSNRLSRDSWQVSMNDRNKEHGPDSLNPMSKSFYSDRSSVANDQGTDWEHSLHSSMSDVSQTNGSGSGQGSKQLIAHSARVQTPQRHHSESVLYLDRERSQRKLYPVSTTKLDDAHLVSRLPSSSPQQAQPSVAERISELEKQQQHQQQMRYTYLDPDKRHRVSDPTLKAIQKKALLSFYERHQHQASWRSEPHLLQQQQPQSQQRHSPPPQPPPRPRPASSRRASSASDYASGGWREKANASKASQQQVNSGGNSAGSKEGSVGGSVTNSEMPQPRHQHSNSCGSLSTDLLGPVIVGPAISIDDWVPERPPKKPHLRTAYSDRLPSPDLPPPSPPTVTEIEVLNFDDPLPPPPPELSQVCSTESRLSSPEQRHENSYFEEPPSDRIKERNSSSRRSSRKKAAIETSPTISPTKSKSTSPNQDLHHSFHFEKSEPKSPIENGFSTSSSRILPSGRSSLRYSSTQKHLMNEKIAAVRRSAVEERLAPLSLANNNQLPDLMPTKYNDSGNQRAAPQVPVSREVEPKIKRQESVKLDESMKPPQQTWLEPTARQKPRVQAPKCSSPPSPPHNGNPKSPRSSSGLASKYQQRSYFALPAKYSAEAPPEPQPRTSLATNSSASPPPPPLAPRTPASKKLSPPPRPAPPLHAIHQGSQSKASYLAYRRERGAPDSEGSYKRTMSPNARLDDPVLLKVTPHHQQPLLNNNNNNNNNNTSNNNNNNSQYQPRHQPHPRHELSKSQSSDALQHRQHQQHRQHPQRLDDHFSRKSLHNIVSSESADSNRSTENSGNGRVEENGLRRSEKRERLSPQSVEVLNDRNRQLERERRKLAASCEPQSRLVEDFYRESAVTTIEMTSQNVEMLNRRNEKQRMAAPEARSPITGSPKFSESPSSPSTPPNTTSIGTSIGNESISDRKVSSPSQTDQSGSSWDRKSQTSLSSSSSSSSTSSSAPSSPSRTSPSESRLIGKNSSASSSGKNSPCVSPQPGLIEGLTLVQRTEVVLRVNAPTNDVASQTELPSDESASNEEKRPKPEEEQESLAKPRKKLQEEIECEELSRDLANQLGPNDKLLPILVPVPEHKKSTDYVVDLFRVEAALQPRPRPRLCIEDSTFLDGVDNESEEDKKIDSIPTTPVTPSATDSSTGAPLSPSSPYFTTSESKARFLTRYSQEVVGEQVTTAQPPSAAAASISSATTDNLDLRQKKEELMIRLDKKLVVLRAEQEAVREEGEVNEALGARVAAQVAAVARPAEASKYRLHVDEVGQITSLLLGLSGRLARAENALYGMPADHAERKILESKRDKLIDQLEEAKILKGNIDRRSVNVSAILSKYLSDEEFADYQHFINMKAKLIVDGREIQDKVKLGEEQLAALKEAIDL